MSPTRYSILTLLAACYAPTIRDGVPCGANGECPVGFTCDTSSRCVRNAAAVDDAATDDAPDPADAAPETSPDAATNFFADDFERADGAAIGNGWIEKLPDTFSLTGGEVTRVATTPSYRDNLVYRPASENLVDVEASIRVRFVQTPIRFPQIFVRARTLTITATDSYDGYLLYVNGSSATDSVVLGRQLGNVFVTSLATITTSMAFNTTDTYRFILRATGTTTVTLGATVERRVAMGWEVIGSASYEDAAAERITEAGTVGFSGDEIAAYVYDDFRRTAL